MFIQKPIKKLVKHSFIIGVILFSNNAVSLQKLDQIVVVVNDEVITKNELDQQVHDFSNQLKLSKAQVSDLLALRKQVLERMIQNKIQLQKAREFGITVDDITLNRMLEQLAASNNMTLDKLKKTLSKEGIEFGRFREQSRDELIIKELQKRMVANRITVSDQEVQQYVANSLNQSSAEIKYNLLHILIAIPEAATPDVLASSKNKAEKIYSEILQGADFSQIAIKESNGRNALNGGELGWRSAEELPPSFVEQLEKIGKGEVTPPIQSASGYHLLKLLDSSRKKASVIQTRARHILIRSDNSQSDQAAQTLLADLKKRIASGENFSDLAKQHSQDPGTKEQGGLLGWSDPGQFVAEFEDTMNNLKINEISAPFRTQFGWHILQVLDRREQDRTLSNMESKARSVIRQRKVEEELRLWLRRIRDEAFVEYTDSSLIQN